MRLAHFLVAIAALSAVVARADARTVQPWTIGVAWQAPVGHFQPHAADLPSAIPLSPSQAEQERRDRELDAKLKICRGC